MLYTTREDAKTAVENSGILEMLTDEQIQDVITVTWANQIEPEEAAYMLKILGD